MNTKAMRNCGLGSLIIGVRNRTMDMMNTNIGTIIGTYKKKKKLRLKCGTSLSTVACTNDTFLATYSL